MLENTGQHKNVSLNMDLKSHPLPSPVVYVLEVFQILEAVRTRDKVTVCNARHNHNSLLCGSIDWAGGLLPLHAII